MLKILTSLITPKLIGLEPIQGLIEMKDEWETLEVNVNCFVSEDKWRLVDALISNGDLPKNVTFFKEKIRLMA